MIAVAHPLKLYLLFLPCLGPIWRSGHPGQYERWRAWRCWFHRKIYYSILWQIFHTCTSLKTFHSHITKARSTPRGSRSGRGGCRRSYRFRGLSSFKLVESNKWRGAQGRTRRVSYFRCVYKSHFIEISFIGVWRDPATLATGLLAVVSFSSSFKEEESFWKWGNKASSDLETVDPITGLVSSDILVDYGWSDSGSAVGTSGDFSCSLH